MMSVLPMSGGHIVRFADSPRVLHDYVRQSAKVHCLGCTGHYL